MDRPANPARRRMFQAAGATSLTVAIPMRLAAAPPRAPAAPPAYAWLTPHEAAFVEAAVARLIPLDELGPGALEAGVPEFIDRQLAGAWGAGERLYRSGPWREGSESQGYQLPFTPAELFRHAIRGIAAGLEGRGGFAALDAAAQDRYLGALEQGEVELGEADAKTFFKALLDLAVEGYFGDPHHGGNRGMAAWQMIGFPGAYSNYYDAVDRHGEAFTAPPTSLAHVGDHHGHAPPAGKR